MGSLLSGDYSVFGISRIALGLNGFLIKVS
jgi:hypothetical protein